MRVLTSARALIHTTTARRDQIGLLLTSLVDLGVLLEAALLVEASPANIAAVRLFPRVDPLVPLQVSGMLETFPAEGASEAALEHQAVDHPAPHVAVQVAVRPATGSSRLPDVRRNVG